MPKNKNNPNKIQERDEDKEIWLRLGVTVFLPKKIQNIKDSKEFEKVLFKALKNKNYKIEGDSYIPDMDEYAEKFMSKEDDWDEFYFEDYHVEEA